jgi:hypothetical protein
MATKGAFVGKRAWTISFSALKVKVIDCLIYLGVFSGVVLGSFSLTNLSNLYYILILGSMLTPVSMIIRDKKLGVKGQKVNWWKKGFFYFLSTLGLIALLGFVKDFFFGGLINSGYYLITGLLLTFFSRYNLKKHKIIGIIEDFVMYLGSFLFVSFVAYGVVGLTNSPIVSAFLIIIGAFLAPFMLMGREKAIFKRPDLHPTRKYWSMLAVVLGLGFCLAGVLGALLGVWLLSVFIINGVIFMLGGALLNPNRNLITLKDIV